MNLIPVAVADRVARKTLTLQQSSPTILFAAGVVGVAASTVLACRATLKVDQVLEEAKERKMLMDSTLADPENGYNEHDHKKDVTLHHFQTSVKLVELYAPAIIVGGLAIAALTTSNRMLTKRNAALTAAYTALDKGFKQYRARVVDRFGEDVDQEMRYGSEKVQITDPDTHRKKVVTRVGPEAGGSIYARFWDPTNQNWHPDPDYAIAFLKNMQNYWNDRLLARGHVFLNEVYDSLGFEHTSAGAIVGWVVSRDGSTDNYISFGIFEGKDQKIRDFVNGYEGSVLLDFNVDGPIYNRLDETRELLQWPVH